MYSIRPPRLHPPRNPLNPTRLMRHEGDPGRESVPAPERDPPPDGEPQHPMALGSIDPALLSAPLGRFHCQRPSLLARSQSLCVRWSGFAIIVVPSELTTMAGRRLRNAVRERMIAKGPGPSWGGRSALIRLPRRVDGGRGPRGDRGPLECVRRLHDHV